MFSSNIMYVKLNNIIMMSLDAWTLGNNTYLKRLKVQPQFTTQRSIDKLLKMYWAQFNVFSVNNTITWPIPPEVILYYFHASIFCSKLKCITTKHNYFTHIMLYY